ncbi:MAG: GDSL-type esterase/lipase family protein [Bacillota bacterium]|nr:GDSL-type esterase/lipase family protein [Bacillota bacterium]
MKMKKSLICVLIFSFITTFIAQAGMCNASSVLEPDISSVDLNSDGAINMADVMILASAFNTYHGDLKYNVRIDLNSDDAINMADVIIIAKYFNRNVSTLTSTPTQTSTPSRTQTPTSIPTSTPTQSVKPFDPCPTTGNAKILPLGDSITAGAGAQPGDYGGYRVELFARAVKDNKHITFVGSLSSGPNTVAGVTFPKNHEGHIGWKIDQISSIATTSSALKDMPHIVLLFIGTNDEGYDSSQPGASDRLGKLIDKIVAALPNSLLVVSSIYPFPGNTSTNGDAAINAYNAAIPGIIKQRADQGKHIIFVDMSKLPSGALSTDNVHPNSTVGYPWMGDKWYEAIKSYLH